jgi:hypothetical protein
MLISAVDRFPEPDVLSRFEPPLKTGATVLGAVTTGALLTFAATGGVATGGADWGGGLLNVVCLAMF